MRGVEAEVTESRKTQSSIVRRNRLFVGVAGDGVDSVGDGLLSLSEDALTLILSLVASGPGLVTELLGGRLLAI
jgi:hypothetical protein